MRKDWKNKSLLTKVLGSHNYMPSEILNFAYDCGITNFVLPPNKKSKNTKIHN